MGEVLGPALRARDGRVDRFVFVHAVHPERRFGSSLPNRRVAGDSLIHLAWERLFDGRAAHRIASKPSASRAGHHAKPGLGDAQSAPQSITQGPVFGTRSPLRQSIARLRAGRRVRPQSAERFVECTTRPAEGDHEAGAASAVLRGSPSTPSCEERTLNAERAFAVRRVRALNAERASLLACGFLARSASSASKAASAA
jgi:hypothetical protein